MINGKTVQEIKEEEEAMDNSHIDEQIKDQEFANQIHRDEIGRLTAENDKEWCQLIESVLGWHPVGQTDFLEQGLKREYPKLKAKVAELESTTIDDNEWKELCEEYAQVVKDRDRYSDALKEMPRIFNSDQRHKASKMVDVAIKALGVKP